MMAINGCHGHTDRVTAETKGGNTYTWDGLGETIIDLLHIIQGPEHTTSTDTLVLVT